MKSIRFYLMALAAFFLLASCEKEDDFNQNELIGTWVESYDDEYFVMDGSVQYTFNADGTYRKVVNHYVGHAATVTETNTYGLDTDNRKLSLNYYTESGTQSITYDVVKLNSKEMSLQREGTTYSRGTLGSDFRHFVRR